MFPEKVLRICFSYLGNMVDSEYVACEVTVCDGSKSAARVLRRIFLNSRLKGSRLRKQGHITAGAEAQPCVPSLPHVSPGLES